MTADWDRPASLMLLRAVPRLLVTPRLRAIVYFRLSQWMYMRALTRPLAYALQSMALSDSGAELHPAATIGPGFALIHSSGVVVGHEVVAGRDLVLYQGVTLGHDGSGNGQPTLGDGVRIGAGAKLLGPINIGDGVRVGANAVVLADVPTGLTVVGVWKKVGST